MINSALNETFGNLAGNLIIESDKNSNKLFTIEKGRDASTEFEKTIALPVLEENENKLLLSLNKNLDNDLVEATYLRVPDESEKGKREIADFFIGMRVVTGYNLSSKKDLELPINIKYTKGDNKDNVMGKQAFSYMLTGNISSGQILQDLSKTNLNSAYLSDYYVFSFEHGKNKPTESFHFASILDSDPKNTKSFSYNSSQSFPLQAKVKYISKNTEAKTLKEKRLSWVIWHLEGLDKEVEKNSLLQEGFKEFISK